MATLYDVPAEDLIEAVAAELEDRIEEPEWVEFAKSGVDRELPPEQDDFWYVRTASQELEEEGLVETAKGEGRRLTDEGRSFLDSVAGETLENLDRPELEKYA